jgi:lysophospholipase L1-like esterase
MSGLGRTVRGGRLTESETVVIRETASGLVYEAHPSGQPPATFKAVSAGERTIVFEDPAHDFPQRVGYAQPDPSTLTAWIEGTREGKARRIEFRYRRVPCPGPLSSTARALPTAQSPQPAALGVSQWEDDIRAFEAADRAHPPAAGGILFAGSSSIRMWTTLAGDFPGLPVLNRGFGGSQIREVTAFVPRIVLPYEPRLIVFYCGANDIASGRPVAQVVSDFRTFVATVRASLPGTRIAFVSAAPNPDRWHLRAQMTELNAIVREWARGADRVDFIDVWPAMLGPDGLPKAGIYLDDQLHMNARGYEIWTRIVGAYLQAHQVAPRP